MGERTNKKRSGFRPPSPLLYAPGRRALYMLPATPEAPGPGRRAVGELYYELQQQLPLELPYHMPRSCMLSFFYRDATAGNVREQSYALTCSTCLFA